MANDRWTQVTLDQDDVFIRKIQPGEDAFDLKLGDDRIFAGVGKWVIAGKTGKFIQLTEAQAVELIGTLPADPP